MPAEREPPSASSASGIAVALLIVAGAVVVQQFPLVGSRPPSTDMVVNTARDVQDVEARLWQDPFAAAAHHHREIYKTRRDDKGELKWATEAGHPHRAPDLPSYPSDVAILAVPIPGGSFAEEAEDRRRKRYAVLAALNVANYVPFDADRIGFFEVGGDRKPPANIEGGVAGRLPEIVPFERFDYLSKREADGPRQLVVLWLDESALGTRPLTKINAIINQIYPRCSSRNQVAAPLIVLGPSFSDTLHWMTLEGITSRLLPCLIGARMYSYSATAPATQLLNEAAWSPEEIALPKMEGIFKRVGIDFVRTIRPDQFVMTSLVKELERRGADLGSAESHVALISEWDTFASQSSLEAFTNAMFFAGFCQATRAAPRPWWRPWPLPFFASGPDPLRSISSENSTPECTGRLHRYSYLRGLDGAFPASPDKSPGRRLADTQGRKDEPAKDLEQIERAQGGSQFDYLRRLATRLDETARDLPFGHRFVAVGVVGTDVYDKLLVLQALRPQLRDTLFFTTDLDARLLHRSEFATARNLIVASAFGLRLRPELQRDIPPFRDTYQTSAFLSTLIALRPSSAPAIIDSQSLADRLDPRVFEIGRGIAFDLTLGSSGTTRTSHRCNEDDAECRRKEEVACAAYAAQCEAFHPWRDKFFTPLRAVRWGVYPAVVVLGTILLFLASVGVRRLGANVWAWLVQREGRRGRLRKMAVGMSVGLGIVGIVIWRIHAEGDSGEPFSWSAGISMWPTEIIRLVAAILGICLLIKCRYDIQQTRYSLTQQFFGATLGRLKQIDGRRSGRRISWRHLTRIWRVGLGNDSDVDTVNARKLWRNYLFESSLVAQALRVIPSGLVFFAFSGLLILIFGWPHLPYRGHIIQWVDRGLLLGFCVPLLILLIFVAVDAIRLCDQFTNQLERPHPTKWPRSTVAEFEERTGVREPTVSYWIDIQFIAEWTRMLGPLMYYPLIIMALMLIARSPIFDDWDMPLGLIAVFTLAFAYTCACAYVLRRAAERTRGVVVRHLSDQLLRAKVTAGGWREAGQIEVLLEEVRAIRSGVFAPLSQQPLVRAALVPLSSVSALTLIEHFLLR